MNVYECKKIPGETCVHEACRPQGPISEELKQMDIDQRGALAEPVIPQYKAYLRFGPEDAEGNWETPYEITVNGPAAFVAHVVTAAADGFEEDAQR